MFATNARIVPDSAFAACDSFATANCSRFSTFSSLTWSDKDCFNVPSGPLTEISLGENWTSTLAGTSIGKLPILDIAIPRSPRQLCNDAQNLAADAEPARFAVGHHALRGRYDGYAETIHHFRNAVARLVNAQPRAAHALELLNDRAAGVILEADFQRGLAVLRAHCKVVDVAFVLEDFGDRGLHLARGHCD